MLGIACAPGVWRRLSAAPLTEEHVLDTPFGTPSSHVRIVAIDGVRVALVARAGEALDLPPSGVNARANLYALKQIGVSHVVLTDEVRSLRGALRPGDLVVADQVLDLTASRPRTFFDQGIAVHVELARPTCDALRARAIAIAGASYEAPAAADRTSATHSRGTLVGVDGPSSPTDAEADVLRRLGGDVVGQTAVPDVRLAREAEMCCLVLGCVEGDVELARGGRNLARAKASEAAEDLLRRLAKDLAVGAPPCACQHALDDAVDTPASAVRADVRARYGPLLARFFGARGA